MSSVSRFETLKSKKESYEKQKVQYEVTIDSLGKELTESIKTLQEKYGVADVKEAKELLVAKDVELKAKSDELDAKLAAFEKTIEG